MYLLIQIFSKTKPSIKSDECYLAVNCYHFLTILLLEHVDLFPRDLVQNLCLEVLLFLLQNKPEKNGVFLPLHYGLFQKLKFITSEMFYPN